MIEFARLIDLPACFLARESNTRISMFSMSDALIDGLLLAGTIGFDTTTSWLQLAGWLTYIGLTLKFYLAPSKKVNTPANA